MRLVACVLVALLAAGCSSVGSGGVTHRPPIDDLLGCSFKFPDNTSVDCAADVPHPTQTTPGIAEDLASWRCAERLGPPDMTWELWTNDAGRYGMLQRLQDASDKVSVFSLEVSHNIQKVIAHGSTTNFYLFPTAVDPQSAATWRFQTWFLQGNLTYGGLRMPLVAHAVDYQGWPWFTWTFSNGTTTYNAESMGVWRSVDGDRWQPFSRNIMNATYTMRVSALQYNGEGTYVPPSSPDMLLDMLTRKSCA